MTAIEGRRVTLYLYRDGAPRFVACATSCSMDVEAEEIEITTVDSGKERDFIGGFKTATLSVEGIVTLDELPGFQFDEVVDLVGERERLIVIFTDSYDDVLSYDMTVLVKSVSNNSSVSDFSSFSANFLRCGAWTKIKTYDNILIDGFGDPILDGDGNLIRVP